MPTNEHDQAEDFAHALRNAADTFEAPMSQKTYDGAVAHGRRMRRRGTVGVSLSVIGVLGVAGLATTALSGLGSTGTGTQTVGAAAGANSGSMVAAASVTQTKAPAPTATATSGAATVKQNVLALLPAGVHATELTWSGTVGTSSASAGGGSGAGPTAEPKAKQTDNTVGWTVAFGDKTESVAAMVTPGINTGTCDYLRDIAKEKNNAAPDCTTTQLPGGGSFLVSKEVGKTALPSNLYYLTTAYIRPDGSEVSISQTVYTKGAYSTDDFAISPDQARTMVTSPLWNTVGTARF